MELKGEGYIPTYTRTDITDELHEKLVKKHTCTLMSFPTTDKESTIKYLTVLKS